MKEKGREAESECNAIGAKQQSDNRAYILQRGCLRSTAPLIKEPRAIPVSASSPQSPPLKHPPHLPPPLPPASSILPIPHIPPLLIIPLTHFFFITYTSSSGRFALSALTMSICPASARTSVYTTLSHLDIGRISEASSRSMAMSQSRSR